MYLYIVVTKMLNINTEIHKNHTSPFINHVNIKIQRRQQLYSSFLPSLQCKGFAVFYSKLVSLVSPVKRQKQSAFSLRSDMTCNFVFMRQSQKENMYICEVLLKKNTIGK